MLIQPVLIALAQIRANLGRSLLATLGIVIGIASTLTVIACLSGLERKILGEFERYGADTFRIQMQRPDSGPLRNARWWRLRLEADQLDGMLAEAPDLRRMSRIADSWERVRNGDVQIRTRVSGIEPDAQAIYRRNVIRGRPLTLADEVAGAAVALVNPDAADELGLRPPVIGRAITIGNTRLNVVGVIEPNPMTSGTLAGRGEATGAEPPSYAEVFVPFSTMQRIDRYPWISAVAQAESPAQVEAAQGQAGFFLRRTRSVPPGTPDTFRFESDAAGIETFSTLTGAVTAIAAGIVSISLLVGGVGIMNIMLVSVSERTREIGLRKAVGATPAALLLQFLTEAAVLCLLGGLLGVLLAQAAVEAARLLPDFPLDRTGIPLWALALAFGFSATIGIAFGFFPALKAARLDPITALRHE